MRVTRNNYEPATELDGACKESEGNDVAWYVLGWETAPDADTEWSGIEPRTGNLVVCMVGDDQHWSADPEELEPISREDYCGECGQIGCAHDGLER